MKSNIQSETTLPPGVYWVCDPAHILPPEMIPEMEAGELPVGIWDAGDGLTYFIGDTEFGKGCFAFEDWYKYNGVETDTGYIGVFPDSLIREMKMVTQMKRWSSHGVVKIEMEEPFSVDKMDYGMDVGYHRLTKVLGE